MTRIALFCAAILTLAATHARAAEPGVSVTDAWMRLIIRQRPAAGYFTLTNTSDAPKTLTGAASPGCGMLMLHQSMQKGGEDSMAMVDHVVVPAHGAVTFAPGGYHLMCMQPAATLAVGGSATVTLHFADGGTLTVPFPVRGAHGK
jgi:copper(I)-binding protein